jgi:hypothetical protein
VATPAELTAALARIDQDTTAVAAVITDLRDRISTSMTADDVTAVQSTLDGIADRREATAKTPDNPVPPGPVPQLRRK